MRYFKKLAVIVMALVISGSAFAWEVCLKDFDGTSLNACFDAHEIFDAQTGDEVSVKLYQEHQDGRHTTEVFKAIVESRDTSYSSTCNTDDTHTSFVLSSDFLNSNKSFGIRRTPTCKTGHTFNVQLLSP